MEITQPHVETLQQQYAMLQDKITLGTAEVERLQSLSISELYKISQLILQKKELFDEIDSLTISNKNLTDEVATLNVEFGTIKANNDKLRKELDAREDSVSQSEDDLSVAKTALDTEKKETQKIKEDFQNQINSFLVEKQVFVERVDKIKSAIN